MLKLINILLYHGKFYVLTMIFFTLLFANALAQDKKTLKDKEPLKIEIDDSFIEERPSITDLLYFQMSGRFSEIIYTKSIFAFSFCVDSSYTINSSYSENMPISLKKDIFEIFKRWTKLGMQNDVEEKRIITNRIYVVPIVFHFKDNTLKTFEKTFKKDYEALHKYLKSMDWSNTELMDFLLFD